MLAAKYQKFNVSPNTGKFIRAVEHTWSQLRDSNYFIIRFFVHFTTRHLRYWCSRNFSRTQKPITLTWNRTKFWYFVNRFWVDAKQILNFKFKLFTWSWYLNGTKLHTVSEIAIKLATLRFRIKHSNIWMEYAEIERALDSIGIECKLYITQNTS